jgi:FkbM family methyltransferase
MMTDLSFLRRVRRLKHVMSLADAFKLACNEGRPGEVKIYLPCIARYIILRGATSDSVCFDKVFLDEEYRSPYDHQPQVIVDAGANTGMATLYFFSRYPTARIVAIEPQAQNFEMLQRNCAQLPNVTLLQAALWPKPGRLIISDHYHQAWAYSVKEPTDQTVADVRAISVNDIFGKLGVDRIDLLKLDIEGSERELFSADSTTWLDRVGFIVIELHDRIRPGCAKAFYSALVAKDFEQDIRGESIFIKLH